MNNLTLTQVQTMRRELEQSIQGLLTTFTNQIGMVLDIDVLYDLTLMGNGCLYGVSSSVEEILEK